MKFQVIVKCMNAASGLGLILLPLFSQASVVVGTMLDKNGQPVQDAVFYATPIGKPVPRLETPPNYLLSQENYLFSSYVSVLRKGTKVKFSNLDARDHHVKSFSPAKNFEIRVPGQKSLPDVVTFDALGEVALVCHFHDFMRGYIYVVDTPYFGKTDKDGNAMINNLPAGKYKIEAWVPNMIADPFNQIVQVTEKSAPAIRFKLDYVPKPPPVAFVNKKESSSSSEGY
jgi:hypothetical protein